MTGRIGLKNMWMYTPHLANLLYFQDNYSNVLLLEWLKMTCQSRMDVRNCLKWLWLRWSWNHVSYVGPTWSWFTSHTRQDIAGQIWAMYLMRNPCRWPLSHILGSTQIDSFLGPETDRSCIYMYIYIYLNAYLYWYNTYTRVYNVHMYDYRYMLFTSIENKVTRICSQINDSTSPMELQMKEHHDICLLNSGNNLICPCLSCIFKLEFNSGNTW